MAQQALTASNETKLENIDLKRDVAECKRELQLLRDFVYRDRDRERDRDSNRNRYLSAASMGATSVGGMGLGAMGGLGASSLGAGSMGVGGLSVGGLGGASASMSPPPSLTCTTAARGRSGNRGQQVSWPVTIQVNQLRDSTDDADDDIRRWVQSLPPARVNRSALFFSNSFANIIL